MQPPPPADPRRRARIATGATVLLVGIAVIAFGLFLACAGSDGYGGSPFDGMHLWALPGGALVVGGVMLLRRDGGES